MGMSLNSGGHLTHGAKPTYSGKNYKSVQYEVNPETYLIDYDEVEKLALENLPRLIICGASAYPRVIDFEKFREITDKVNEKLSQQIDAGSYSDEEKQEIWNNSKCYLMADISHIAGLVVTGLHPSPFPYCDIVTTTTHKTMRNVRGGLILTNDDELAKKIDKAVFPRMPRWRITKYHCS
jgi:glycine hydroxymethyltransferase